MIIRSYPVPVIRKNDYSDKTIVDVSKLVKASENLYEMEKEKPYPKRTIKTPILAIPGENKIYCYYGGMTLVVINDNEWKLFGGSNDYDKHVEAVIEENCFDCNEESIIKNNVLDSFKKGSNLKKYLFDNGDEVNTAKLKLFMLAAYRGRSGECEKCTQQVIALNNCTFEPEDYSVCGFEIQFSGDTDIDGTDLVIFSLKKKKMYLVEYICQKGSLDGDSGIIEYGRNYSRLLDSCRKGNEFCLKMLNSYNLMRRIKSGGNKIGFCRVDPAEIDIEILFLFTGTHVRNDENVKYNTEKNLTPDIINQYVKKLLCDDDETLIKMRKYINFYWEKDYSEVNFDNEFV